MKTQSKTDWARVKREAAQDAPIAFDAETDAYNPNDAKSVAAHWESATIKQSGVVVGRVRGAQKAPLKVPTTIRFDADVLAALKASGKGWQTRVNEAMREWIKTHSAC
ncbi:MAG: BrnA antitoxin family protein [Gallionella sp.]|nr:BrnA antitoxin family protein [Gallionella sp.]